MKLTDKLLEKLHVLSGYPRLLQNTVTISQEVALLPGAIYERMQQRPWPFVLIFIQAVKVEKRKREVTRESSEADKAQAIFTGPGEYAVEEEVITDKPITLSVSGEVPKVFSFQPDVAIANLQIAVICDVRMVRVDDICVANHHLCPAIEAAPLAYHAGIIGPWHRITISTSLR